MSEYIRGFLTGIGLCVVLMAVAAVAVSLADRGRFWDGRP